MTIYVDVVLIENLIMNYIILLTTGLILKIKIKHIRLIIASLLGAVYSVVAYGNFLEIYSSFILKIVLSIIIVYIAYYPQSVRKMCKEILFFYLISFVFGGAAFSLIYLVKPQDILMKNGLFLGTYPLKTVMLASIVAFFIIITAFAIIKSKFSKKDMVCEIEIKLNNKIIKAEALIDTGNMLKEPITNTPVVVIEHTLLYDSMPKEILNHLEDIIGGDFGRIPEEIKNKYVSKLKLIPFSSLGKQNGMLIGIKPEYLKIIKEEQINVEKNVIIGIYDKSLTRRGEYRAIIGMEFIWNIWQKEMIKIKLLEFLKSKINTACARYLNENNEIEYLPIFYIAGSQTLPPPLPPEEEEEYIKKLAEENNLEARQILVERNLRLVVYIAKKFENTGIGIEDLISIGTIGLMKGVNTFNSDKKIKLATYASRCIENEILMFLRKNNRTKGEVSIDEPLNKDRDGNELLLSDILGTEPDITYRNLEDEVDKVLLKNSISKLNDREKNIMEMRFGFRTGQEKTQKEVADELRNFTKLYLKNKKKDYQ